jgi:hypothetical protein
VVKECYQASCRPLVVPSTQKGLARSADQPSELRRDGGIRTRDPLTPSHGQGVRAGPGESAGESLTSANAVCGRKQSGEVCRHWLPSLAPSEAGLFEVNFESVSCSNTCSSG